MTRDRKINGLRPAAELLTALRKIEVNAAVLKPGQARRFRSKMARRNAFQDLLAMAFVEGRS